MSESTNVTPTTNTHSRPERNGDLHMSNTASTNPAYTYRDLKKQLDAFTDNQLDDQVCAFDHDCGETLAIDRMVDPIPRADNPTTGRDYAAIMLINENVPSNNVDDTLVQLISADDVIEEMQYTSAFDELDETHPEQVERLIELATANPEVIAGLIATVRPTFNWSDAEVAQVLNQERTRAMREIITAFMAHDLVTAAPTDPTDTTKTADTAEVIATLPDKSLSGDQLKSLRDLLRDEANEREENSRNYGHIVNRGRLDTLRNFADRIEDVLSLPDKSFSGDQLQSLRDFLRDEANEREFNSRNYGDTVNRGRLDELRNFADQIEDVLPAPRMKPTAENTN